MGHKSALVIGKKVNNYDVISLLGEGGMGSVYLAQHPFMGRRAAIKVLRPDLAKDSMLVLRFMNEARAANAIRHPNIIDIIDVGIMADSDVPYLMMEFLDGEALSSRIRRNGHLSITDTVEFAFQTAGALGAAHEQNIVHRDLKPDNLFVIADTSSPGKERVKVLDFGIAKLRGDLSGNSSMTQTGSLMGTPPYMSPEQCRGLIGEIDARTDIYALGIILYEMLTGAPPFVSEGFGEVLMAHLSQPPPPLRDKNPDVPPELERIVIKALAKKREDRYASMDEMRAALRPSSAPTLKQHASALLLAENVDRQATMLSQKPEPPKAPTTLRHATGEVAAVPEETDSAALSTVNYGKRARIRAVGIAGGAAVAVAIALITLGRSKNAVDAPVINSVPVATTPARTEPPPAPDIHWSLDSTPTGAEIADATTGEKLGVTPFEKSLRPGTGSQQLTISRAGFSPALVDVPRDAAFQMNIKLVPTAVPSPVVRPKHRAPVDAKKTQNKMTPEKW